ncbi:AAA protein [Sulfitobacter phage vB_SupP_AX]|nr:AAA protein [Sulfitobacter phage vB_SupP_AX]
MIFVFGSNKSGIHGAGAAAYAHKKLGAKWGIGEGITGGPQQLCYALPTKGFKIEFIPLEEVANSVTRFIEVAEYWALRHAEFQVTQVGCGLGGFTKEQIAPLFKAAPDNCLFDDQWKPILGNRFRYWGTF